MTISPDGRQIAYSWYNEKGLDFYDLRIIDLDGSNMRVLYHDTSVFYIVPYAWSPDGREILAYFADADKSLVDEKTGELFRQSYLVLVSAVDGSHRVLKTWQRRSGPKRAAFSPDGRYVAYDFGQEDDLTRHDIYLMDLDSGDEIALIEHPADDRLFGWVPDGQKVVFASDRTSRPGLWMIDVTEGTPQGSARLLKGDFEGDPIGFTVDGSFYYSVGTATDNVYVAMLDSTGAEFEGEPRLASSQFVGSTSAGDFSSDGKFLAYRAIDNRSGNWVFVICSVETSQERIVTPSPSFRSSRNIRGPRFSPDGQSLLVCGTGQENGKGVYTVDTETGAAVLIDSINDNSMRQMVWSPDGKSIYVRSGKNLSKLDPASGEKTELYQGKGLRGLDVSPDGRWLAFNRDLDLLAVLPSAGGEPREVIHFGEGEVVDPINFVRWMPDGEHLLFYKYKKGLWKVHVETGAQQQIGPAIENLVSASIHPDGSRIAFTVHQEGSQLWVMENFLPD